MRYPHVDASVRVNMYLIIVIPHPRRKKHPSHSSKSSAAFTIFSIVMMRHQDPGADSIVVEPEDDGGDVVDVVDVESPLAEPGGPGAHHPLGGPPAPRYRHKSHSQR